jgi:hypothetical protein
VIQYRKGRRYFARRVVLSGTHSPRSAREFHAALNLFISTLIVTRTSCCFELRPIHRHRGPVKRTGSFQERKDSPQLSGGTHRSLRPSGFPALHRIKMKYLPSGIDRPAPAKSPVLPVGIFRARASAPSGRISHSEVLPERSPTLNRTRSPSGWTLTPNGKPSTSRIFRTASVMERAMRIAPTPHPWGAIPALFERLDAASQFEINPQNFTGKRRPQRDTHRDTQ